MKARRSSAVRQNPFRCWVQFLSRCVFCAVLRFYCSLLQQQQHESPMCVPLTASLKIRRDKTAVYSSRDGRVGGTKKQKKVTEVNGNQCKIRWPCSQN